MTIDFCMFLLHFAHMFPERYDVDNLLRLRHWQNDRFSPIDSFPRVPRKKTFQTSIIKARIQEALHWKKKTFVNKIHPSQIFIKQEFRSPEGRPDFNEGDSYDTQCRLICCIIKKKKCHNFQFPAEEHHYRTDTSFHTVFKLGRLLDSRIAQTSGNVHPAKTLKRRRRHLRWSIACPRTFQQGWGNKCFSNGYHTTCLPTTGKALTFFFSGSTLALLRCWFWERVGSFDWMQ